MQSYKFPISIETFNDIISKSSVIVRKDVVIQTTRRLCGDYVEFFENEISKHEGKSTTLNFKVRLKVNEGMYYPDNSKGEL